MVSIDEVTYAVGKYVTNVIVGILSDDEELSKKIYSLNVEVLEKANSTSIARLFDDSVKINSENFDRDLVLLFISDAAPYMVKAGKGN